VLRLKFHICETYTGKHICTTHIPLHDSMHIISIKSISPIRLAGVELVRIPNILLASQKYSPV